jgi:hypothetical protein
MSDQSQGEGWWQASDGKWYPPPRPDLPAEPAPTMPAAPVTEPFGPPGTPPAAPLGSPTEPPSKSGLGRGPIIGIAVAAVVVIAAIVFFLTRGDDDNKENVAASTEQTDQTDSTDQTDQTDASSDSTSSSSQVDVPSGFKEIRDDAEGVSIAVPRDFVEIDPETFLDSSNQSEFSSLNPELAPFLSSGNAFLNGSVLAATGSSDGSPSFVVVAKSPQAFDPQDPRFAEELKTQLLAAGASNVTTENVTLPAGDALRLGVTLNINTPNQTGTVNETLYFVQVGRTTWGIIGASVGSGSQSDLFDQIAETFTVTS